MSKYTTTNSSLLKTANNGFYKTEFVCESFNKNCMFANWIDNKNNVKLKQNASQIVVYVLNKKEMPVNKLYAVKARLCEKCKIYNYRVNEILKQNQR